MKATANTFRAGILLTAGLFAWTAQADIIKADGDVSIASLPDAITGGFTLTDLVPTENPLSSIAHTPGTVYFEDKNGNALPGLDPSAPDWWHGTGLIYTTTTDTMIIEFEDLYVTAFTFRLGANKDARAWISADYSDDLGGSGSVKTDWFGGIGPNSSPAYGVFVTDSSSCRKLDRVTIDPTFRWGLGQMQIATNSGCTQVPEPGSLGLLGIGLLALGFTGWRRSRPM